MEMAAWLEFSTLPRRQGFSRRNAAEAALAGLAVLGGGTRFFDWLIS